MSEQALLKAIICIALMMPLMLFESLKAQSDSHSGTQLPSNAVDVKGVRHRTSDYGEGPAPWISDIVKSVRPEYPSEYRARP
jgi:hypothetical protein